MAVYIYAANIRNSFGTEKSFLIKFLFLMLFSLFPPRPSENLDFLLFITVLRAYKAL